MGKSNNHIPCSYKIYTVDVSDQNCKLTVRMFESESNFFATFFFLTCSSFLLVKFSTLNNIYIISEPLKWFALLKNLFIKLNQAQSFSSIFKQSHTYLHSLLKQKSLTPPTRNLYLLSSVKSHFAGKFKLWNDLRLKTTGSLILRSNCY